MGPDAMSEFAYEVKLRFDDGEDKPIPTERDVADYLLMLRDGATPSRSPRPRTGCDRPNTRLRARAEYMLLYMLRSSEDDRRRFERRIARRSRQDIPDRARKVVGGS
jgi:hypothetical protein